MTLSAEHHGARSAQENPAALSHRVSIGVQGESLILPYCVAACLAAQGGLRRGSPELWGTPLESAGPGRRGDVNIAGSSSDLPVMSCTAFTFKSTSELVLVSSTQPELSL